jgi:hypothetical protein
VPFDQRVPELPLCTREMEAVSLDRGGACAAIPQLLALGDELGDQHHERLDRGTPPSPPETGPPQGPDDWAASHTPSIGEKAAEV